MNEPQKYARKDPHPQIPFVDEDEKWGPVPGESQIVWGSIVMLVISLCLWFLT